MKKKATALKYQHNIDNAPNVIASGDGYIANNIIKLAKENNIPIKEDEDLVELLSKLDINQEIPEEMYKAVAEIFSFVYSLTQEVEKN